MILTDRKKLKVLFLCVFAALCTCAFGESKSYEIDYIKGNFSQKTQAVKRASEAGDYGLVVEAINFCVEVEKLLGDNDRELNILVETSVRCLKNSTVFTNEQVAALLCSVFTAFSTSNVRIAVLEKLNDFPSSYNVNLVNAYIYDRCQSGAPMDDVLKKAIQVVKVSGNSVSFWYLFSADVLLVWPDNAELLQESYGALASSSEAEVLNLFSKVNPAQKSYILSIISKNKDFPAKIQGEVAENVLSEAIISYGENKDFTDDEIKLQLDALEILSNTKWTRASSMASSYFVVARKEYEAGRITDLQFSNVISNVTSIASGDTCQVLSQYLDFLNKSKESGNAPVKAVVLSVINALGELGNKSAFDYLLYVTYLDYGDDVVAAARNALSNLKW